MNGEQEQFRKSMDEIMMATHVVIWDVAHRTGLTERTIESLLDGKRVPTWSHQRDIAKALDTTVIAMCKRYPEEERETPALNIKITSWPPRHARASVWAIFWRGVKDTFKRKEKGL